MVRLLALVLAYSITTVVVPIKEAKGLHKRQRFPRFQLKEKTFLTSHSNRSVDRKTILITDKIA